MQNYLLYTCEILLIVVTPLLVLYIRGIRPLRKVIPPLVIIPVLWYFTYAPLHELSHAAGIYLVGGKVIDYKLIPRFWLKVQRSLALGSVGFRVVENVFVLIGTLSLLSLLTLSQEFIATGSPEASSFQTLGAALLALRDWQLHVITGLAFSLGVLMYYAILYRSNLIARWLSGWGVLGVILALAATVLASLTRDFGLESAHTYLHIPIASMPGKWDNPFVTCGRCKRKQANETDHSIHNHKEIDFGIFNRVRSSLGDRRAGHFSMEPYRARRKYRRLGRFAVIFGIILTSIKSRGIKETQSFQKSRTTGERKIMPDDPKSKSVLN